MRTIAIILFFLFIVILGLPPQTSDSHSYEPETGMIEICECEPLQGSLEACECELEEVAAVRIERVDREVPGAEVVDEPVDQIEEPGVRSAAAPSAGLRGPRPVACLGGAARRSAGPAPAPSALTSRHLPRPRSSGRPPHRTRDRPASCRRPSSSRPPLCRGTILAATLV